MANTFVVHTSGSDANGGGYIDTHSLTWGSSWHDGSFGTKLTLTNSYYQIVGVNQTTIYGVTTTGLSAGILVYVTGNANIADGRYVILSVDAGNSSITISSNCDQYLSCVYNSTKYRCTTAHTASGSFEADNFTADSSIPFVPENWTDGRAYKVMDRTSSCVVGGALGTVKTCVDLEVTGDIGLLVESATEYSVSNDIAETGGQTIVLRSAKESDGSLWNQASAWNRPVILATASGAMLSLTTATCTLTMRGIVFDGDDTAANCILTSGSFSHFIYLFDSVYKNATGAQVTAASSSYQYGYAYNCEFYGDLGAGTIGYSNYSTRPSIYLLNCYFSNLETGIYINRNSSPGFIVFGSTIVDCTYGLKLYRVANTETGWAIFTDCIFKNTNDVQIVYYSAQSAFSLNGCVLYGTSLLNGDNSACILTLHGCAIRSGITSVSGSGSVISNAPISISSDPFVDSDNATVLSRDYRLNPASADFASLYDWTTGQFIGALGPGDLSPADIAAAVWNYTDGSGRTTTA